MEAQTAFPIYTLLKLQEGLEKQSDGNHERRCESLVWFLSYKGEEWRLHGCFTVHGDGVPQYVSIGNLMITICRNGVLRFDERLTSFRGSLSYGKAIYAGKMKHSNCCLLLIIFLTGLGTTIGTAY